MAEPRNASECQERQGDRAGGGVHDRAGQGDKRQAVYAREEGACETLPHGPQRGWDVPVLLG